MFPTTMIRARVRRASGSSPRHLRSGPVRASAAVLLALVVLVATHVAWTSTGAANAATVGGSNTTGLASTRISLLPLSKAYGPWEWYRSCESVPSAKIPPTAASGCQHGDPTFGPFVLNGDLWNLASTASGDATMTVNSSGVLTAKAAFPSAPRRSGTTWVLGYPNVSYGVEPQAPRDSPPPSPKLPLPVKVSALPTDLLATADSWVIGSSSVRFDFAYDLWLEPQLAVQTPRAGTIELMIWTYDSGSASLPPGYKGQVSMNDAVNGKGQSAKWGLYVSNGDKSAPTQTTVDLVLTNQVNAATVSVDLNNAIRLAESALKKYDPAHWSSFAGYYLDSIPLGSELGAPVGKSGSSPLLWSMDDYFLSLGAKLP